MAEFYIITPITHTLPEKLWNIWRAQWKHSHLTLWFARNGLAPTTNKFCYFDATFTWSVDNFSKNGNEAFLAKFYLTGSIRARARVYHNATFCIFVSPTGPIYGIFVLFSGNCDFSSEIYFWYRLWIPPQIVWWIHVRKIKNCGVVTTTGSEIAKTMLVSGYG